MNKKGFTLIELLAVIIILSLLALLTTTSVTKIVKNSKQKLYKSQINSILLAADAWGADNLDLLPSLGSCNYILLSDLKDAGVLNDVIDPVNNNEFSDDFKIYIYNQPTKTGKNNIKYSSDKPEGFTCQYISYKICTRVFSSTLGQVPTGQYQAGDKYRCQVNDTTSYNFYILNTEEDNVNLIMDRNIVEKVKWGVFEKYGTAENITSGPTKAFQALYDETKDWTNISNINLNYTDEYSNSFTIMTTENSTSIINSSGDVTLTLTNLKARLPKLEEVKNYSSTKKYLLDNLKVIKATTSDFIYGIEENLNSGSDSWGYWTLSSSYLNGYYLNCGGDLGFNDYDDIGVRPVITLDKSNLD